MKKISKIIAYSLLCLIVVGIGLMAIIKKDFSPNIKLPSYEEASIQIKQENPSKSDGLGKKSDYDTFVKEYENSFKLTILYSLFSGEISREQKVEYLKSKPSTYSSIVVDITYTTEQTLMCNGKVYNEGSGTKTEIKYKNVFFVVEEGKGLETKSIYFLSTNNSYYQLTTLANFDGLYNFIMELNMFKAE